MSCTETLQTLPLQRCMKEYNNSKLLTSIYHNPVIYIRYTFPKIGMIVLIATLQRQRLQRIDCTNAMFSRRKCIVYVLQM